MIRTIPTVLSWKQAMFMSASLRPSWRVLYCRNILYNDLKPQNLMDHTVHVKLIYLTSRGS